MRLLAALVPLLGLTLACTQQRASERPDALTETTPSSPAPDASGTATEEADPKQAPDVAGSFDACLDRVLKEAGLNRYGDEDGTMYAGGTPLFDERTGTTIDRRAYVAQRRPDLVARCDTP